MEKPKKVEPKVDSKRADSKKRDELAEKIAIQQKVEARLTRPAPVKPIEPPKTTLEAIGRASDKRNKLAGKLIELKAFGPRAQGVEETIKEIEVLNKVIVELKAKKLLEDARGR